MLFSKCTIDFSILLCVLAALLVPVSGTAQPSSGAQQAVPSPGARADSVFADLRGTHSPGCAVSVMRDGEIVHRNAYGMANLEYGIPLTSGSIFHVASISKQFTAMAVQLLVEEGKVSWNDDIREHVPEVPDFGAPITLRHLAHHTSGLRDQWELLMMAGWRWEADVVRQEDVLDIVSRQKAVNFRPGERHLYSNTGYTLLTVVVERATGKSLREFTRERIFRPLGMEDTHFHDDHQHIVPGRAYAYAPDPEGTFGFRTSIPDFAIVGASSLFTTVEDLARWDRNFVTGEVGGSDGVARLQEVGRLDGGEEIDYALGLVHGSHRGLRTVGHGGADAGYRGEFLRLPEEGLSVAVLCNLSGVDPRSRARRVANVYLDESMSRESRRPGEGRDMGRTEEADSTSSPERMEVPDYLREALRQERGPASSDPESWRELAGAYYSEELGTTYEIRREGEELHLWHRKWGGIPLRAVSRDAFLYPGLRVLSLLRDGRGRVVGLTLSSPRAWNVRFEKME